MVESNSNSVTSNESLLNKNTTKPNQDYSLSQGAFGNPNLQLQITQNDIICAHLYQTGFLNGQFHDLELVLKLGEMESKTFRLHRLILSQSKYFFKRLTNERNGPNSVVVSSSGIPTIQIDLSKDNELLSEEAIAYNIAFLYNQFPVKLLNDKNAFEIYIASVVLGTDLLTEKSYLYLTNNKEDMAASDLTKLVADLQKIVEYYKQQNEEIPESPQRYIEFGKEVLINKTNIELQKQTLTADNEIVDRLGYMLELPFDWFKELMESSKIEISHMERFKLTKIIINRRNQIRNKINKGESVIMSFGSSSSTLNSPNKSSSRINILSGEKSNTQSKQNIKVVGKSED